MSDIEYSVIMSDVIKSFDCTIISLIQHFEADFQWKVSHKILNSEIILKAFTHASYPKMIFFNYKFWVTFDSKTSINLTLQSIK